jgi:hypothetical protein
VLLDYEPKSREELFGVDIQYDTLKSFYEYWEKGRCYAPIFQYGMSGLGKTCVVKVLAKELNTDLKILNLSGLKLENSKRIILNMLNGKTFEGKKFIALFEDIDLANKKIKNFLFDNIPKATNFIILNSLSLYNYSLSRTCLLIEYHEPSRAEKIRFIKYICRREGISLERTKRIAEHRDFRSILNAIEGSDDEKDLTKKYDNTYKLYRYHRYRIGDRIRLSSIDTKRFRLIYQMELLKQISTSKGFWFKKKDKRWEICRKLSVNLPLSSRNIMQYYMELFEGYVHSHNDEWSKYLLLKGLENKDLKYLNMKIPKFKSAPETVEKTSNSLKKWL